MYFNFIRAQLSGEGPPPLQHWSIALIPSVTFERQVFLFYNDACAINQTLKCCDEHALLITNVFFVEFIGVWKFSNQRAVIAF